MPSQGVRRSSRIPKEIELLLVGSDMEGKVFSEKTKTVLLSRFGAGIISEHKLSPEQELILRRLDTDKEAEVRVVGRIGEQDDKYTYGVAFLDQSLDYWDIPFPLLSESEVKALRVVLECVRCQVAETVQQSDLESDVYLVNEGIVRFCKRCGSSTFWKRAAEPTAEPEVVPVEVVPPPAETAAPPEPAPAPKPAERQENRRKHARTKVNFKACVRTFTFGEDIVVCEDVSRGGLRFKSPKRYDSDTPIEVAVPYSPGSQNIFVPARIIRVQELKEEKLFRCGVSYTAATKT